MMRKMGIQSKIHLHVIDDVHMTCFLKQLDYANLFAVTPFSSDGVIALSLYALMRRAPKASINLYI